MDFLQDIQLIQGGMGVYVSNWRLARSVALERPGVTAGTVSGTGLDIVYTRLLQLGDPGGHVRRALGAFDAKFGVAIGRKIIDKYYIEGGKAPEERFRPAPAQIARPLGGGNTVPLPLNGGGPVPLEMDPEAIEMVIATSFAEVWLAKEGHQGRVFINLLKKVELPLVYVIYGAMLADVDGVIIGAGNPDGLPEVCTRLASHLPVSNDLLVLYRETGESFHVPFDPKSFAGGRLAYAPLKRPAFLAIVSLENLVEMLANSQTEPPDGFIIEHHTAGGHNAGPQGTLKKDELGQPLYSEQDEPDLAAIRQVGMPFWLAGGYNSHEKLKQARAEGALGVQVGTMFALAQESGLKAAYRTAIFDKLKADVGEEELVHTALVSPTGFPFKVVQLPGTLAEEEVYNARRRVCDIGLLAQRGLDKAGEDGSRKLFERCPAAPMEGYLKKRGLPFNAEGRRCLCNGLLSAIGLGQVVGKNGLLAEEPAIITLGNNLEGVRRLSRRGQSPYYVHDVVEDILG